MNTMNKRRPELKRSSPEISFKFSTAANLREAGVQLEKKEIWFRVSGRRLVTSKDNRIRVQNIIEELKPTVEDETNACKGVDLQEG